MNTNFTLGDFSFGVVRLHKDPDPDKYGHSAYDIRFDACSQFSLPNGEWGKNFNNAAIFSVKGNDNRIYFFYWSKDEAINLLSNANLTKKSRIL